MSSQFLGTSVPTASARRPAGDFGMRCVRPYPGALLRSAVLLAVTARFSQDSAAELSLTALLGLGLPSVWQDWIWAACRCKVGAGRFKLERLNDRHVVMQGPGSH